MISISIVKVTVPGTAGTKIGIQATDEHGMQLLLPMEPSEAVKVGDRLAEEARYLAAGIVAPSGSWRPEQGGGS